MWKDLDDKRWIVLVSNMGGKEGEMEEWDLIEEFFRDPYEEEERGVMSCLLFFLFSFFFQPPSRRKK